MNLGQYVKTQIKIEKAMTISGVADKMVALGVKADAKALSKKLNDNKLTAVDLVAISKIVGFSLDKLMEDVEL